MNDCEVLVVGGGLTGLSCAMFLAWHGVDCVLVERHPDLLRHPRQRSQVPRTLELFRQVGLEERIQAARVDFAGPSEYVAVRAATLAGEHTRLDQQDDALRSAAFSPCTGTPIDQDVVEDLLRTRARELGARIHFGTELRDFDGTHAYLRGSDGDHQVRARYLVAADGADSPLRERLGIRSEGPGDFYDLLSLTIDADLRPALAGRTVHMAYLEHPGPRTFLMALDRDGRHWVFGTADDPASPTPDEDRCVELVQAAAGIPAPVHIRPQIPGTTVTRFRVGASVAATFRSGPVFLIGDAAHLMPPTGGFGGATGVQDAHNLAWKLAAVLRGDAGEALLDTYDEERRPVAHLTMRQALARSKFRFGSEPPDEILDRATVMLGYGYRSAAVPGGSPAPVDAADLNGRPGTRAPHVPLPDGTSTIDLYGSGFVLLTGPHGKAWAKAARDLPMIIKSLEPDAARRHGIALDGALLVRPDGIVAWRGPAPVPDPADRLVFALDAALAKSTRAGGC
jgi:putative polyketide hydroxylase